MNDNKWIDVSVSLQNGMVHWPGDPDFKLHKISSLEDGEEANISVFSSCVHIGTHIDAPLHFIKDGKDTDSFSLESLIGEARVIEIKNRNQIIVEELKQHAIKKGERILFKTVNSNQDWLLKPFDENYIALSNNAASYLAEIKIAFVGIDYLSIAGMNNSKEIHIKLLEAGICIVEGLDFRNIKEGTYEMICLPLKLKGSDGAPARMILRVK